MAITTTGFQAPATKREGLKPSVYENIILIGADETPILKLIRTSRVKGIEHSWLTDSLAAPKKNAQLEISDFDDQIKSSVQKTSNAVQIFTSNVSVSRSMQAVATYGGKELERETAKRAKEHKLDMEYAILVLVVMLMLKRACLKHQLLELTQQLAKWQVYFTSWLKVQGRILLKMLKEKYII